jgi:hypothetical protein
MESAIQSQIIAMSPKSTRREAHIIKTKGVHVHRTLALLLSFLLVSSGAGLWSQQQPTVPPIRTPGAPGQENEPSVPPDMQKEMEKKANEQRHADLKRDTDRLLKLSTELKEYVDKTNENVLSLDVIKKADEIEKLAHSVKTKMRGSY